MADRYGDDRWAYRGQGDWDDRRAPERDPDRYRDRPYARDRHERGAMARGVDEVRSWFGDDEAQRRREVDEYRDRMPDDRRGWNEVRGWSAPDQRTSGIGREWRYGPQHSSWQGADADQGMGRPEAVDRDRYPRENARYDPSVPSERDRSRIQSYRSGYFDSSMGYGGASTARSGSLNPFRYRGPGSFAGRGPKNYQRSDERIREDVIERLTDDDRVDASDVDVTVRDGEVTLGGQVHDRRMRRAAEECIEDLSGVRDIRNELRLGSTRTMQGEAVVPREGDAARDSGRDESTSPETRRK